MPIEPIIDNVALEGLPQAAFAATLRLLIWYWKNECKLELPERSIDRLAIARAHQSTWVQNETEILRIYVTITKEFDIALRNRDSRLATLKAWTDKGIATKRARRLNKSETVSHLSNHAPQRRADIRQAAAEARAVTAKEKGFSD